MQSRYMIAGVVTVMLLMFSGGALPAEDETYPIWWSPSLGLESLDQIDERLEQKLWPDDDGFRLFVGIGKNRKTVIAHSCADIRMSEKEGSGAIDSPDIYLWPTIYRECIPIERVRDAKPARKSYVRDFVLDAHALDHLPAILSLAPSCDWLCRLYAANERRIPWRKFETKGFLNIDVISEYEIKVETEIDLIHIEILARADFNLDGLEDLFVKSTAKAKEGRWGDDALFTLSREEPDGVLWVLNAERYICSLETYHPCDTRYDEPPALR